MKQILTPESKKTLRAACRYINSLGSDRATFHSYFDEWNNLVDSTDFKRFNSHNLYTYEVPEKLSTLLYMILEDVSDDVEVDDRGSSHSIDVLIDCVKQDIIFEYSTSWMDDGHTESFNYSVEEDESIKEIFDSLNNLDDIKEHKTLTLSYNGSGDSGYIENDFDENIRVPGNVEDWCYRVLEDNYPGWEINEGSKGFFEFYLKNKLIIFQHTNMEEYSKTDTIYEESFSKEQNNIQSSKV